MTNEQNLENKIEKSVAIVGDPINNMSEDWQKEVTDMLDNAGIDYYFENYTKNRTSSADYKQSKFLKFHKQSGLYLPNFELLEKTGALLEITNCPREDEFFECKDELSCASIIPRVVFGRHGCSTPTIPGDTIVKTYDWHEQMPVTRTTYALSELLADKEVQAKYENKLNFIKEEVDTMIKAVNALKFIKHEQVRKEISVACQYRNYFPGETIYNYDDRANRLIPAKDIFAAITNLKK